MAHAVAVGNLVETVFCGLRTDLNRFEQDVVLRVSFLHHFLIVQNQGPGLPNIIRDKKLTGIGPQTTGTGQEDSISRKFGRREIGQPPPVCHPGFVFIITGDE
jgi:hypothetical protein